MSRENTEGSVSHGLLSVCECCREISEMPRRVPGHGQEGILPLDSSSSSDKRCSLNNSKSDNAKRRSVGATRKTGTSKNPRDRGKGDSSPDLFSDSSDQ